MKKQYEGCKRAIRNFDLCTVLTLQIMNLQIYLVTW